MRFLLVAALLTACGPAIVATVDNPINYHAVGDLGGVTDDALHWVNQQAGLFLLVPSNAPDANITVKWGTDCDTRANPKAIATASYKAPAVLAMAEQGSDCSPILATVTLWKCGYGWTRDRAKKVIAHEVGHVLFGVAHADSCIMSKTLAGAEMCLTDEQQGDLNYLVGECWGL